jgi:hypothetical protein
MNTCLSNIYLKLCQLDSRHVRMILVFLTLMASGGILMGLPISGDVGG